MSPWTKNPSSECLGRWFPYAQVPDKIASMLVWASVISLQSLESLVVLALQAELQLEIRSANMVYNNLQHPSILKKTPADSQGSCSTTSMGR